MTERKPNCDRARYREALRASLASPRLAQIGPTGEGPPQALQAAFRLAIDLGWCRLLAIDLGQLPGSLPIPRALAAARAQTDELICWGRDASDLSAHWSRCDDPEEAEALCVRQLERRMDAWASYIVLDAVYLECLEDRDEREHLVTAAVNELVDRLSAFDRALQGEMELLSLVCNSTLLDSWRHSLAPPFRDPLPWWLDGRLERAAKEAQERALASLPGAEVWKERRHQLEPGQFWGHRPDRLPALSPPLLAEAAPRRGDPLPALVLSWQSPDGSWRARLVLPEWSTPEIDEQARPVTFTRSRDDTPAAELNGLLMLLAGVEGRIAQGQAWFRLAQLREADDLTLHVGEMLELWQPIEEGD
jgi:hypothetical protein